MKRWLPPALAIVAACTIIQPVCGCSPVIASFASVSGIVVDTAGTPLSSVLVAPLPTPNIGCGTPFSGLPMTASPSSVATDANGMFAMDFDLADISGTHCIDLRISGPMATDTVRDVRVVFTPADPPSDTTSIVVTLGGS